jgi:dolichol-phosphate mannosyltransferase
MDSRLQQARHPSPALSLVLYSAHPSVDLIKAVHDARQTLNALGREFEILVLCDPKNTQFEFLPGGSATDDGRVRVLRVPDAHSYRAAWMAAAAESRYPLVAISNGTLDFSTLDYLLPLGEHYSLVWGNPRRFHHSFIRSVIERGYSAMARLLLDTRVRDQNGGTVLSLLQRAKVHEVALESEGMFTATEVLAKARQMQWSIAEVPIASEQAHACSKPGWKDWATGLAAFMAFWWSRVQFPGREPTPPGRASWILGALLLSVAALVLFTELNQPLFDPDEGRQAEIPREMMAHDDLLTPRMLGLPYYEKPPLQYWLTALAYSVFGIRPWVARLVPAWSAWLAVLFTFCWSRKALGTGAAFLGGLGLCLCLGFVTLGRTVILDSLLASCVVGAWLSAHVAIRQPQLRWGWWVASAVMCGLGILAKGPVALVLLVPPVFSFQILTAHVARPRLRPWLTYLGVALAIAAPWYLAMAYYEPGYLTHFLWKANLVRFLSPYDHEQPWWFYLPILFIGSLPWSFLWPWEIYFLMSRRSRLAVVRTPALGFCVLAACWCLLFFSLSGCKSPPYLAPAFAPLGLVLGTFLDALVLRNAGARDAYLGQALQRFPRLAVRVLLLVSVGCYLANSLLGWQTWGLTIIETVLTLGGLAAWWHWGRRAGPRVAWAVCALATLLLLAVAARDLAVGFATRHSPAIARLARRWPGGNGYPVVSYLRQWPSASFYLRRDKVLFFAGETKDSFLQYLDKNPRVLVLVESGPPLQDMLQSLPRGLKTDVQLPNREGQAALVMVRH